MRIPMPSPRGTNHEGLFISTRHRNPVAAYDARRGLAADAALSDETMKAILDFLAGKVGPDDLMKVKTLMEGAASDPDGAADEPADFPGKPKPGGTMTALDRLPAGLRRRIVDLTLDARGHREAAFAERFPNVARIEVL